MAVVDEVSPVTYGQDLIRLTLSQQTLTVRAFGACLIDVDYSLTLPAGIVLPLEFTVSSSAGAATYQRRVFRRLAPQQISFLPREGGPHLVRLAESHHNRWFGSLLIEVDGAILKQS
jgi:hypothetical protein